jgi:uncharacterized protein (DUF1501 family)
MANFDCPLHLPRDGGRRDFLRTLLLSAGILALGPLGRKSSEALGAPRPNHKRLVVVNLAGGADTLNIVVPVGLSSYYSGRPSMAIQPAAGLALSGVSGQYKLHPSMPKIAALWNSGDALAVQKTGYPGADLSHFVSQDIFSYGVRNVGSFPLLGIPTSGWIARYADLFPLTPLGSVAIGRGRPLDFVGGQTRGLTVNNLSNFKVFVQNGSIGRIETVKTLVHDAPTVGLTYEAKQALMTAYDLADQVQQAVADHNTYLSGSGITYPNSSISTNLKDVAALIYGGFETSIFYVGLDGWDTHGAQLSTQATLLNWLDGAVGAFSDEMKALGVWDDIVMVVITEFGRRSYSNGGGTDHGHGFAEIVMGGPVNGGRSYGPDLTNADLANGTGYLPYSVDFRSIYKEILTEHLGVNASKVLPETLPIDTTLGIL